MATQDRLVRKGGREVQVACADFNRRSRLSTRLRTTSRLTSTRCATGELVAGADDGVTLMPECREAI